jgi:hypothetical protein
VGVGIGIAGDEKIKHLLKGSLKQRKGRYFHVYFLRKARGRFRNFSPAMPMPPPLQSMPTHTLTTPTTI